MKIMAPVLLMSASMVIAAALWLLSTIVESTGPLINAIYGG